MSNVPNFTTPERRLCYSRGRAVPAARIGDPDRPGLPETHVAESAAPFAFPGFESPRRSPPAAFFRRRDTTRASRAGSRFERRAGTSDPRPPGCQPWPYSLYGRTLPISYRAAFYIAGWSRRRIDPSCAFPWSTGWTALG